MRRAPARAAVRDREAELDAGAAVASFVAPGAAEPHQVATFTLTAGNACGATAVDTASVILKGR